MINIIKKVYTRIFDFSKKGMPVIVIDKNQDDFSGFENPTPFPESTSESYLIADLKSGHIFAQKNINQKMPIASITKLMTALVAVENIDLKKNITITKEDLEYYGDNLGIEIGDKATLSIGDDIVDVALISKQMMLTVRLKYNITIRVRISLNNT